jgi:hypothetical protein
VKFYFLESFGWPSYRVFLCTRSGLCTSATDFWIWTRRPKVLLLSLLYYVSYTDWLRKKLEHSKAANSKSWLWDSDLSWDRCVTSVRVPTDKGPADQGGVQTVWNLVTMILKMVASCCATLGSCRSNFWEILIWTVWISAIFAVHVRFKNQVLEILKFKRGPVKKKRSVHDRDRFDKFSEKSAGKLNSKLKILLTNFRSLIPKSGICVY